MYSKLLHILVKYRVVLNIGNLFKSVIRTNWLTPILFLILISLPAALNAQPIPVGDLTDQQFRLLQLYSDSLSGPSLMNRPLWKEQYDELFSNSAIHADSWWATPMIHHSNNLPLNSNVGYYSPRLRNTFNTTLPYGGNNGAAWFGRGLTSELRAGIYFTSEYLTITLHPHLVWQQNSTFREPRFIPRDSEGNPTYRGMISGIDSPFRFGPNSFTVTDWGDSSIRLHYNSLEAGLSSESLWWGPGIQNALLMSNNAPGVKQLFVGSRSPINLPFNIGQIEFRLTGAFPEDSDYYPSASPDRYTSGTLFIFSPSFIQGLHIGAIRLSHMYIPDEGLSIDQIFSSQPFAERQRNMNNSEENEMASVFFRWVLPKSSAEIYGEYFREDSFFDLRDLYFQPDHDRAYTIGFQKLIKPGKTFDLLTVQAEISNLVPNRVDEVRPQTWYYRHSRVRQGHTNRGQVLGAAIGPGSGSQFIKVNGFFQKGMIGLFFQRVEDNDYHFFNYYDRPSLGTGYKDLWRNRVNLNVGIEGKYRIDDLLFEGGLVFNHNLNYGRYDYGDLSVNFDTFEPFDLLNIQFQLSVRYLF